MLKELRARYNQGFKTIPFPQGTAVLPARYCGLPEIADRPCSSACRRCVEACPVDAIKDNHGKISLDLGRCLFCAECSRSCPQSKISFSRDYRLAANDRLHLLQSGQSHQLTKTLNRKMLRIFGRSLKLRQVSAGGCGACEADTNVLNTIVFDLSRFGIEFVASPRHADGLLITGPVTKNMRLAVEKTYAAIPAPKIVIAVGACAISGGHFDGHEEVLQGAGSVIPVDLYIPGCPPHPLTILDGLLRLLGKIDSAELHPSPKA